MQTHLYEQLYKFIKQLFILTIITLSFSSYASEKSALQLFLDSPALLNTLTEIDNKNTLSPSPKKSNNTESEITGISSGEELLLSLYVGNNYLSDLYAYKSDQNAQLGLISLFELLDFAIDVNLNKKNAAGWFIDESNTFNFDWSGAPTLSINGQKTAISALEYRIENDDVYVDANSLEKWFLLNMVFNFTDLKVQLSSEKILPLEQRLKREKQKTYSANNNLPVMPWKASNYQFISAPIVDIQLNASANENNSYGSYSVLASHDLAYLNSQLFASGNNNDSLSDLRLTFSKEDNKAQLLGFLNATKYQFADITPVKTALGDTAGIARGVLVSNHSLSNISNNRTTTFSGNIQPGWDVELYRNGLLLAREVSLQNGRYDFNDITLLYGDNQFELVFYGPQGQVRTETEQIYIDGNSLKAKQSSYAFSSVDVDTTLFDISNQQSNNQPGWLSTGIYEYGLSNWFSVHAGIEYLLAEEGDDRQNYSVGSNITLFERLLFSADFQQDNQQHQKMLITGRAQAGQHSFYLSYHLQDLFLWTQPELVNKQKEYEISMVGNVFSNSFLPINYQNYWNQIEYNQQNKSNELTNQLAFYTPLASVTHEITWRGYDNEQLNSESIAGFLRLQRSFGRLYSRLQGLYSIKPEQQLKQLNGELSYPLTLHLQSELELDYYPDNDRYRAQLGLNWQYDAFSVNTTVSYNNDDIWTAGLFTRFSFGYEPINHQYFASHRTLANSGALMARVYQDDNLNNQYDEGETLLKGAKIKGVQNHTHAITDEQGIATIHSLTNQQTSDFILDKDSLEDPFLIPATPGISLTPRKGYIELLEFPVVTASELEGNVYIRDAQGNESPGAYIKILLHDETGKLVTTTETEFDGYYLFTELLPGEYNASIEVAYSKKKKLKPADKITVNLMGDVVNGADFTLTELDFIKGYTATLASFNSLSMLKTYWQLTKHRYQNALNQQVFYIKNNHSGLYDLHGAFFRHQDQAEQACSYLAQQKINCKINSFEFDITPE